ncbi:type II toxin-antitoxin system VapB family antitoxin [Rhizobium cauense]|uniref:type II toxin-antitoxin system VapB family antitoxin n=1 Tax=Rhizobium cauense TaxID=1166683 RepID=UPI001C6EFAAE|nr:type II toxin-antitoxin system VapB family antitoxin [Rhizobium cauense]MBW9114587.1 type II toxin-antitoxin system VapB family antitoxin [Rhizobium cauense]
MALIIKDHDTEQLARTLAQRTGESITLAIKRALEERLLRLNSDGRKFTLLEDLQAIQRRWNTMPVLDHRTADEILGYDGNGLPS